MLTSFDAQLSLFVDGFRSRQYFLSVGWYKRYPSGLLGWARHIILCWSAESRFYSVLVGWRQYVFLFLVVVDISLFLIGWHRDILLCRVLSYRDVRLEVAVGLSLDGGHFLVAQRVILSTIVGYVPTIVRNKPRWCVALIPDWLAEGSVRGMDMYRWIDQDIFEIDTVSTDG